MLTYFERVCQLIVSFQGFVILPRGNDRRHFRHDKPRLKLLLRDPLCFLLRTKHQTTTTTTKRSLHCVVSCRKPTAMVYIRQDKLPKLKEYKYSGVDHSLLSQYVLKPFYTHVVIKCFPMWMAYVKATRNDDKS